jgi:hypothetical protein
MRNVAKVPLMLNVIMLSVVYVSAANVQLMLNVVMLNVVMPNVMAPLRIGKSDLKIQFYCISIGWHFWACWKGLQHCQSITGSAVSAPLAVQVSSEVL